MLSQIIINLHAWNKIVKRRKTDQIDKMSELDYNWFLHGNYRAK